MQGEAPDTVRAAAWVEFELNESHPKGQATIDVKLGLRFVEDEGAGEHWRINVVPAPGFTEATRRSVDLEHHFTGTIDRGRPVRFLVTSDDYDDDFSVLFHATAEVLS